MEYIERDLTNIFEKLINTYKIIAVVGARQAGKTTFLKNKIKKYKSSYILFDDPDAKEIFEEDIKKFKIQYLQSYEISILDEIQNCKQAGQKLKYLADTGEKLWITSSSEIVLSKEILSYLVGRVAILKLYPFSLNEFLKAKNQKIITQQILSRSIWEHATYGGYPQVIINEDIEVKKTILKNIYETMILKDIRKTWNIDDLPKLEKLVKYLALNNGEICEYQNISNKLNISYQTLIKYLDALEKSYLIIKLSPYFTNKTKEITKQPKIYFLDTGLRNVIAKTDEFDGYIFENYILTELIKLNKDVKYWRNKTGQEVDFIIESKKGLIAIEVKQTETEISKSLKRFIDEYKPYKTMIVCYKEQKKIKKYKNNLVLLTNTLDLIKEIKKINF
ncbi:MAG: ATP-binding protein [Candidatus Micrarchaeia archaeon]|jgi:hypothetical protein